MVNLFFGVILTILANSLMGSINAIINKKFNWLKLGKGLTKGAVVVSSLAMLMWAGWLNPDLVVMQIGGIDMTVMIAVETISVMAFIWYASQTIIKIKDTVLPHEKEKK